MTASGANSLSPFRIAAVIELDWASRNGQTEAIDVLGGFSFNIPFTKNNGLQIGIGLDALTTGFFWLIALMVAAEDGDSGRCCSDSSRALANSNSEMVNRFYTHLGFLHNLGDHLTAFVKGRFLARFNGPTEYDREGSSTSLHVGVEFKF